MRALTVRQPWAHAILHLGKDVENRPWCTDYLGELAIHAGLKFAGGGFTSPIVRGAWWDLYGTPLPGEISTRWTLGAVLGTVEQTGCHRAVEGCCSSPWAEQPRTSAERLFHHELTRPRPFREPVPARGTLGPWTPDERLAGLVDDARRTAAVR